MKNNKKQAKKETFMEKIKRIYESKQVRYFKKFLMGILGIYAIAVESPYLGAAILFFAIIDDGESLLFELMLCGLIYSICTGSLSAMLPFFFN